jgi:hypothetical protein
MDWWEQTLEQELDAEDAEAANGQVSDVLMADAAAAQSDSENAPEDSLPVFAKPSRELTGSIIERRAGESSHNASQEPADIPGPGPPSFYLPTDTPQIRPIPSPGLPIPSPLVSNHANSTGYFTSWPAFTQTEEVFSVPVEERTIASPPGSSVEIHEIHETYVTDETPITESVEPSVMEPVKSHAAPLQTESVMNTGSLLQNIAVQSSDFGDLLNEPEAGTNETPPIIDEPSIIQADVEIGNADQVVKANKEQRLEPFSVEHGSHQHEGEDQDINDNVHSVQAEVEVHNKEEPMPDTQIGIQSTDQADATSVVDEATNIERELNAVAPEEMDIGDEFDGSSQASNVTRSRSQSFAEEDEEFVDEEEEQDEEQADDYESQYDYDDEEENHHVPRLGTRPEQDEFSDDESNVDDSSEEESEQKHNFPSRPGTQEIIVLDSDSEDEPAARLPAISSSQVPEEDNRSESPESGQSELRYDYREQSVEDSSDNDLIEEREEQKYHEFDDQDDRVHDSDKANESSFEGFSGDEDASEQEQEMAPQQGVSDPLAQLEHEDPEDQDSESIASLESLVQPAVDQGSDEEHRGDDYRNVPEVPEQPQAPHVSRAAVQEQREDNENMADPDLLSDTEKMNTILDVDEPSDSHMPPPFEDNATDFVSAHEQVIDTTEINGLGPQAEPVAPGIIASLSEQQLPTPDPTQESALPTQSVVEPKTTTASEQDEPMDIDAFFPHTRAAGSLPPETTEDRAEPDNVLHDIRQHKYGLDGGADDPSERQPLEVIISTEAPETPEVVVTEPQSSIPDRTASGFRSKYSYFAPLATLIDHYNALVDTISIVHEVSPIAKAKTGAKDWFMTIQLTDPSMAGTTLQAQIFRRYKSTFPSLVEGNAVILRDFKVRSFNRTVMIVSAETSAWAVFDGSSPDAEMKGPPVEYGTEESDYAADLRRWYTEMGAARVADHQLQASIERESVDREMSVISQPLSESGSPDSTRSRRSRQRRSGRVTIHSLRDGTRYIEVGSPNSRGSDSIHELRDGTVYSNP